MAAGADTTSSGGRGLGRAGVLVGVGVSVAAVAAVVVWALGQPAPELPDERSDVAAVVAALVVYAVATCLRAERWGTLCADQGGARPRGDLYALTVVGFAANTVLPARAGDALRVVLGAPRLQLSRRGVLGTLLAERLLDVGVLLSLFVVLALTIAGGEGLPDGDTLMLLGLGAGVALGVGAVVVVALARHGKLERGRAFLAPVLASTVALRGRHGLAMLGMSALIWGCEGLVWTLCGAAVDAGFGVLDGFYVLGLTAMFALIPSGPGYAGTVDAAAILGVKAVGGTSRTAVSYVVLVRFVVFVPITIVGLVVGAVRYGGLRRLREVSA